jgi:histidinol-phosphate aminotransferase
MDIAPYVGGRTSAPGVARIIKLSANESPLGASPLAIEAYGQAGAALHRYPDGAAQDLREAIASVHGLPADQIVCGDGSDELLHLLALGFAGPGDEVLSTEFGFVVYPMVTKSVGATPVLAPEKAFTVDVDALLERVTDKTRIVFVANPNSTGTYVPWAELTRLHDGLPGDVLLVIDSAYAEFVEHGDYSAGEALVVSSSNVVMTRTFSKAYGLAALRLGWCYGPPGVIDVLNRLRGPFNVTAPAQAAGIAALGDVDFLMAVQDHVASWRPWLERELRSLDLEPVPSVTNFVLVRFPGAAEAAAANGELAALGILVRDMNAYGLGDCLRITVGTEEELRAFVTALEQHLEAAS